MAETSTCFDLRCGYSMEGRAATCPKCGRKMSSSRTVRIYGTVLVLCGLFLLGLMGTITWTMWPMLMQPGAETAGGSRFTGTADDAEMILWLFALVMLFGLVSLMTGLWQVTTGRRNRWVAIASLGLAAILILYARWTTGALG